MAQHATGLGDFIPSSSEPLPSSSSSDKDFAESDSPIQQVDFDWFLSAEVLNAIRLHAPFPTTEDSITTEKSHLRHEKIDGLGGKKYIEYIPPWTAPNWTDDVSEVKITRGANVITARKGDVTHRVRPALLDQDLDKNPTAYAKRWGIHPYASPEGRSRMSPRSSSTRIVGLSERQETRTGEKAYINMADIAAQNFDLNDLNEFLEYPDDAEEVLGDKYEQYAAMRKLLTIVEDDQDYQRLAFLGLTTDERISHKIHTIDPKSEPQANLKGPLHPFVDRPRWSSSRGRGKKKDKPMYAYNFFNQFGMYTADNDTVWMALQPALQLVTRVLNLKHPYWLAISNLYNRRRIHPSRDPCPDDDQDKNLVNFTEGLTDKPDPDSAALLWLNTNNIDIYERVQSFLRERLRLCIRSCRDCKVYEDKGADHGTTTKMMDGTIRIKIAAEYLWPMLVPVYTAAEKASCTFGIANTILHELTHAAEIALRMLTEDPVANQDKISQLRDFDVETLERLEEAGAEYSTNVPDPYWEDEPRAELGFAFENQLWGGRPQVMFRRHHTTFRHLNLSALDTALQDWPSFNENPGSYYASNEGKILLTPSLHVERFATPLKVPEVAKLFQQGFWAASVRRYGHRALRLRGTSPEGLTVVVRNYRHRKYQVKTFGRSAVQWMTKASSRLKKAGFGILVAYLNQVMLDRLDPLLTRSRWRYYFKTWPGRALQLEDLGNEFDKLAGEITKSRDEVLAMEGVAAAQRRKRGRGGSGSKVAVNPHEFKKLIQAGQDLHAFLIIQVQEAQTLVLEYLQLRPDHRQILYNSYARKLAAELQTFYESKAGIVAEKLDELRTHFEGQYSLQKEKNRAVTKSLLQDAEEARSALERDKSNLQRIRRYLTEEQHATAIDGTNNGAHPSYHPHFSVPRGYHRRYRAVLKKLAMRELADLPRDVRAVVSKYLELLSNNNDPWDPSVDDCNELQTELKNLPDEEPDWTAEARRMMTRRQIERGIRNDTEGSGTNEAEEEEQERQLENQRRRGRKTRWRRVGRQMQKQVFGAEEHAKNVERLAGAPARAQRKRDKRAREAAERAANILPDRLRPRR